MGARPLFGWNGRETEARAADTELLVWPDQTPVPDVGEFARSAPPRSDFLALNVVSRFGTPVFRNVPLHFGDQLPTLDLVIMARLIPDTGARQNRLCAAGSGPGTARQ